MLLVASLAPCAFSAGWAQDDEIPSDFLKALVNPGEKMTLSLEPEADGAIRSWKASIGSDNEFKQLEGEGNVVLLSPRLNLWCKKLVYDAETGLMTATGSVKVKQPGVDAECTSLVYTVKSGELVLTGNPIVKQSSETNSADFEGMEEFHLTRAETGETQIRLNGGDQIKCRMKSVESTVPAPVAAPGDAAPGKAKGFAGLGNDVKITTDRKAANTPVVLLSTDQAGEFSLFHAEGAVVVESETMTLRSETLDYDASKELVEALYSVYIKQDTIDANCGRMLYELADEKITLTVNPEVRQTKPDGILNITQMDLYTIVKNPDGSMTTNAVGGPDGNPKYEYLATPPATTSGEKSTEPVEIDPNNLQDIEKIQDQKTESKTPGGKAPGGTSPDKVVPRSH